MIANVDVNVVVIETEIVIVPGNEVNENALAIEIVKEVDAIEVANVSHDAVDVIEVTAVSAASEIERVDAVNEASGSEMTKVVTTSVPSIEIAPGIENDVGIVAIGEIVIVNEVVSEIAARMKVLHMLHLPVMIRMVAVV